MQRDTAGFTLIELIMVIVLIAVLAAVAIPKLGDQSIYDLERATADLVEAIRYAQEQSMTHSGAAPFQIAITTSGFTVSQNGSAITSPLDGSASYTQNSSEWNGITISAAETIIFDSRGRPSCTVPCSTPGDTSVSLTLSKDGHTRTIIIERYTGYAYRN